jgi:hypothetical protein
MLLTYFIFFSVIFNRELSSRATNKITFWAMQGMPYALVAFVSTLFFIIPVYLLAGLRNSVLNFFYYYFALVLSLNANIYLCQLTAAVTPSPMLHCIIFPGLSLLVQVTVKL